MAAVFTACILISRLQALLHDGRLKMQKNLPEAAVLTAEFQNFSATVTETGYWKFDARAGKHDDLVLAVAIAVWRANGLGGGARFLEYAREQLRGLSAAPDAARAGGYRARADVVRPVGRRR